MRGKLKFLALFFGPLLSTACGSSGSNAPLNTVARVDLNRYLGEWHEVARYPNSFQKDCYKSKAEYSLKENGDVRVLNTCRKGSPDGELKSAEGTAWIMDKGTNAKLKVRFFWPFSGDYWIIDLGEDYDYAVVGEPSREYLWILSRNPQMDDATYQGVLSRIRENGYDPDRLIRR